MCWISKRSCFYGLWILDKKSSGSGLNNEIKQSEKLA